MNLYCQSLFCRPTGGLFLIDYTILPPWHTQADNCGPTSLEVHTLSDVPRVKSVAWRTHALNWNLKGITSTPLEYSSVVLSYVQGRFAKYGSECYIGGGLGETCSVGNQMRFTDTSFSPKHSD